MKTYFVQFSTSGNPNQYAGLSPTFLTFRSDGGTAMVSPSITEIGVSVGFYKFQYTPSPTFSIAFLIDGGSAITSSSDRYVTGALDPISAVDQELGYSTSSYGDTSLPSTVMGYVKRTVQETEADAVFNKQTGLWSNYAKGTTTLLYEKTLANNTSTASKS